MKYCPGCGTEKTLEDFNRSSRSPDGVQSQCRECSKGYYQANASRHKAQVAQRSRAIELEYRRKIWLHLQKNPCVDCGEADPIVLEFDHVRGVKIFNISQAVRHKFAWAKVLEEIAKCDVRCANCHRRKTARQFNYYATVAERI